MVTITRSRVQYNKYFTGFTLRNFLYNNQIRGMSVPELYVKTLM